MLGNVMENAFKWAQHRVLLVRTRFRNADRGATG